LVPFVPEIAAPEADRAPLKIKLTEPPLSNLLYLQLVAENSRRGEMPRGR
jgi:hypothetical protein